MPFTITDAQRAELHNLDLIVQDIADKGVCVLLYVETYTERPDREVFDRYCELQESLGKLGLTIDSQLEHDCISGFLAAVPKEDAS